MFIHQPMERQELLFALILFLTIVICGGSAFVGIIIDSFLNFPPDFAKCLIVFIFTIFFGFCFYFFKTVFITNKDKILEFCRLIKMF